MQDDSDRRHMIRRPVKAYMAEGKVRKKKRRDTRAERTKPLREDESIGNKAVGRTSIGLSWSGFWCFPTCFVSLPLLSESRFSLSFRFLFLVLVLVLVLVFWSFGLDLKLPCLSCFILSLSVLLPLPLSLSVLASLSLSCLSLSLCLCL